MGYLVATSGRVRLPEELEHQALTVLEVDLGPREGWFDADQPVDDLGELARFVGADLARDGDWLVLTTDRHGDPKWSDQATAFYAGLARFVHEGEVTLRGEDGAQWTYRYSPEGMTTVGTSGWKGATPAGPVDQPPPSAGPGAASGPAAPEPPVGDPRPAADPPPWQSQLPPPQPRPAQNPESPGDEGAGTPPPTPGYPPADSPFWSDSTPAPRSTARTVGMGLLLILGIILLVGVAALTAGMVG